MLKIQEPIQDLFSAIDNDATFDIKVALSGDYTSNDINIAGNTALIHAINRKHVNSVKVLISHGADVNARSFGDMSALIAAVLSNQPNMVSVLIESEVNINAQNSLGRTALMIAVSRRHLGIVKLLLSAHANPDISDEQGKFAHDYNVDQNKIFPDKIFRTINALLKAASSEPVVSFKKSIPSNNTHPSLYELIEFRSWKSRKKIRYLVIGVFLIFFPIGYMEWSVLHIFLLVCWFFLSLQPALKSLMAHPQLMRYMNNPAIKEDSNLSSQSVKTLDNWQKIEGDVDPQTRGIPFKVDNCLRLGWHKLSHISSNQLGENEIKIFAKKSILNRLCAVGISLLILIFSMVMIIANNLPDVDHEWLKTGKRSYTRVQTEESLIRNNNVNSGEDYFSLYYLILFSIYSGIYVQFKLSQSRVDTIQKCIDAHAKSTANMMDGSTMDVIPPSFGLYLRPFSITNKLSLGGIDLETALAYSIIHYLPLVALGQPGEKIGAGRILSDEKKWKEQVLKLVDSSVLILIVPSFEEGTFWEMHQLVEQKQLSKTIFIMPPDILNLGKAYSIKWEKTRIAALKLNLHLPKHYAYGLLFTLNDKGVLAEHFPFGAEILFSTLYQRNWDEMERGSEERDVDSGSYDSGGMDDY